MNYQDKLGFYHDKIDADSNNKFIYSAYAKRVGLIRELAPEQYMEIMHCFSEKVRHSHKVAPPLSRDEAMGIVYLVNVYAVAFIRAGFWMCKEKPKFNLFKFIKQIIELFKNRKDRNYWWKNNLDQAQFLTMKLPMHDRAFVYRCAGEKVPMIYKLIEWIDKKKKPTGRSSAAIRSFKYNQDNFEGIKNYFSKDHPIRLHIEGTKNDSLDRNNS
jgi:hypothetical protein